MERGTRLQYYVVTFAVFVVAFVVVLFGYGPVQPLSGSGSSTGGPTAPETSSSTRADPSPNTGGSAASTSTPTPAASDGTTPTTAAARPEEMVSESVTDEPEETTFDILTDEPTNTTSAPTSATPGPPPPSAERPNPEETSRRGPLQGADTTGTSQPELAETGMSLSGSSVTALAAVTLGTCSMGVAYVRQRRRLEDA